MTMNNMTLIGQGISQSESGLSDITGNNFAAIVPVISGQIGGRETNIVSGTSLHKALAIETRMTDWIKRRISEYGFKEGTDYIIVETLRSSKLSSAKSRQQISHEYLTTLNMAKELAMVEKSEQGRAIRRQLKARISAANNFKPMCQALDAARAELGKTTLNHHYSTESNMIAKIVLGGLTAKQWAQLNGVKGEPRDSMSAAQLEHLAYLESTNITLIDMGMDYHPRKAELTRLSQRWLAKRLGADDESH